MNRAALILLLALPALSWGSVIYQYDGVCYSFSCGKGSAVTAWILMSPDYVPGSVASDPSAVDAIAIRHLNGVSRHAQAQLEVFTFDPVQKIMQLVGASSAAVMTEYGFTFDNFGDKFGGVDDIHPEVTGQGVGLFNVPSASVPEPGGLSMAAIGFLFLFALRKRIRQYDRD